MSSCQLRHYRVCDSTPCDVVEETKQYLAGNDQSLHGTGGLLGSASTSHGVQNDRQTARAQEQPELSADLVNVVYGEERSEDANHSGNDIDVERID